MSKELAQTVGGKKIAWLLLVLATLAVFAAVALRQQNAHALAGSIATIDTTQSSLSVASVPNIAHTSDARADDTAARTTTSISDQVGTDQSRTATVGTGFAVGQPVATVDVSYSSSKVATPHSIVLLLGQHGLTAPQTNGADAFAIFPNNTGSISQVSGVVAQKSVSGTVLMIGIRVVTSSDNVAIPGNQQADWSWTTKLESGLHGSATVGDSATFTAKWWTFVAPTTINLSSADITRLIASSAAASELVRHLVTDQSDGTGTFVRISVSGQDKVSVDNDWNQASHSLTGKSALRSAAQSAVYSVGTVGLNDDALTKSITGDPLGNVLSPGQADGMMIVIYGFGQAHGTIVGSATGSIPFRPGDTVLTPVTNVATTSGTMHFGFGKRSLAAAFSGVLD